MKEKDRFILDIRRLGINGEGIGYYNKLAIFVKDAIPGEGVDIEIVKSLPNMAYGKVLEYKKKSPYRLTPSCPHYEQCGACQVMHIDNQKMGEFKRDAIIEAINRYTELNPKSFEIKKTLIMDEPFGYRNKASLHIRKTNGKNVTSMIEEGTNITFEVLDCQIHDPLINEVNKKIIDIANKLDIKSFGDETYSWRYLITRVSLKNRTTQACLVVKEFNEEIKSFIAEISKQRICDSLYVNINSDMKTHEIFGNETIHCSGAKSIIEQIGNYKFNIYPNTFFQLNTKQTEVLYEMVKKAAKLTHQETVLDAFCGVGTISTYLSNVSKKVIGVEYNKESIISAKENLKLNKRKNIEYYQGDVNKLLPEFKNKDIKFDVLVFDPPRTGLGENIINTILSQDIKRIVYVSCNPSTLAKDLNLLSQKYNVKYIQPVDMFPQTSLVESVVLLEIKK